MNSGKVKYFLSISDKINDETFMVVFYVFSSGKKMMSSEFPHFELCLHPQMKDNIFIILENTDNKIGVSKY